MVHTSFEIWGIQRPCIKSSATNCGFIFNFDSHNLSKLIQSRGDRVFEAVAAKCWNSLVQPATLCLSL